MNLAMDLLGILLVIVACFGLLAISNGLIVPHSELVKQEAEEEA